MASFQKRGKTWQYIVSHYVEGEFKPKRKGGFATKKEAQVAALEVETLLKKGNEVIVKDMPFCEYFEKWIEVFKKGKHTNTKLRYANSLSMVKKYFKDKTIKKITRHDYQEFLNWYGKGRSSETVRKLNTHVRACVRDAIEDGYIPNDFTRKIEISASNKAKPSNEKYINFDEAMQLYNALMKRLKPQYLSSYLLLLGLVSGARFGELVGLTRSDFDFKNNRIDINKTWDYKHGTGFDNTKNEKSKRIISIESRTMKEFEKLFTTSEDNEYHLVFHSENKIGSITNEAANKALRNILSNLDIETITVHGLRHTHASILLYKGLTVYYVSERLGHADFQTTLDNYAHVLDEMRERDDELALSIFDV